MKSTRLEAAMALATTVAILQTGCVDEEGYVEADTNSENHDADEPPLPETDFYSVEMEALGRQFVYFGNIQDDSGGNLEFAIYDSWWPFEARLFSEGEEDQEFYCEVNCAGVEITAPDSAVMPDSTYSTSAIRKIIVSNSAGNSELVFDIQMLFGCGETFPEIHHSMTGLFHEGIIIATRYNHNTFIGISPGQTLTVYADDLICENANDDSTCHGPDPSYLNPYGLMAKIGSSYYPVGSQATFTHDGDWGDLEFILPIGWRPEGKIAVGDEAFCEHSDYLPRKGHFDVAVHVD